VINGEIVDLNMYFAEMIFRPGGNTQVEGVRFSPPLAA
jgi:hypothetical protein